MATIITFRAYCEDVTPSTEDLNILDSLEKNDDLKLNTIETATKDESTTKNPENIVEEKMNESLALPKDEKISDSQSKLNDSNSDKSAEDVSMSKLEETDDLQSMKEDIGDLFPTKESKKTAEQVATKEETLNFADDNEEKNYLIELSKKVKGRIDNKDWLNIVKKSKLEKYEVKSGDTLKSISKALFGTEQYYTKIWALNPQITNPFNIEPGTVISFDTGDVDNMPTVSLGEFTDDEVNTYRPGSKYTGSDDTNRPNWLMERKKLIEQGIYFQFASEETYEDLERLDRDSRNKEWEKYDPPTSQIAVQEPGDEYDSTGFDKNSKISFNYKEGFFLNSFVTTNVIQDLGQIDAAKNESVFIHKYDTIYVKFDKSAKVKPGDIFTVYTNGGEIKHPISDRAGFLYTTTAQIKVIKSIDHLWECYVIDQSGIVQRKDRVTVYTPKIGKISKSFGKKNVEAAIIGSYKDSLSGISFGDVVYLDRGRADGVELGNIFDVYSFVDRGTDKKITPSPTYKIGELTVINITDNFATALVSNSKTEITMGSIALTKTEADAIKLSKLRNKDSIKDAKTMEGKALEELDVELNLDDVSQDILSKADKIQLTEDEIEELDRQERDKSIIQNHEKDVKELDRLESEILDAEKSLNESKVDEDKFLEQQSLDEHEKRSKKPDPNAFESINEIETDIGRKYLDEDINNKENPYGLTEFDLEEIDELLNTGSGSKTK